MLIGKLLYATVYLWRKDSFILPGVIQALAPFHLWLFSYLISDLSLSSVHWRWGLHLSTHLFPICFWIIWDPDTLPVTNQIDEGRFCVHFAFHCNHWQPGTLQELRKSEQIWDVPLKMFHGTEFRRWDVLCCVQMAPKRIKVMFMSPSVQRCHMSSDQSQDTHEGCVCSSVLNPWTQPENSKSCWGFKKSDGFQATYYYFENLTKKAKCIQNLILFVKAWLIINIRH